ncbi:hypothetical protein NZ698_06325 [Chryseobacterium sp. PBS4-4]|uniref:Type II toxin-antitoxin system RelE/ParE family toxin n=1 Tax=Chryseobacterium edaphi TaxID=2976532 RepID=A0ABT2W4C3_9FLAO|nr:hypothetical protein [Chryseobacterium edaphi]MCU7616808.1 hypothetical protein [Chryseobacterium edaphi]
MEIIIVYKQEFENKINDLVDILYSRKYFGFEDYAVEYIEKIYDFIGNKISKPISRNTPQPFQKFGKKFLRYKANSHTFWYVFFDQRDDKFLINHILNNHSQDFPYLI